MTGVQTCALPISAFDVEGGGDDGIGVGGKDEWVRSGPSSLGLEA